MAMHFNFNFNFKLQCQKRAKWLKYIDSQMQFKVLFAIYADSESLLIPVEDNIEMNLSNPYTKKMEKHGG